MEEINLKIGDKLRCIKSVNATCLEMCNPNFEIEEGTIVNIEDLEIESQVSTWMYLTHKDPEKDTEFKINAWSDAPDHLITNWFELVKWGKLMKFKSYVENVYESIETIKSIPYPKIKHQPTFVDKTAQAQMSGENVRSKFKLKEENDET